VEKSSNVDSTFKSGAVLKCGLLIHLRRDARARGEGGARRAEERRIDNLLVRIHFIVDMIWWTGLAPWVFEFPFPGSLISTFLRREARARGEGGARRVLKCGV